MPIYEYECQTCGLTFEKRQGFSDEPIAGCPNGHSDTQRLIAAPAIVFKGSGFYINDSKSDKKSTNGTSAKSTVDSESPADSKAEKSTETTTSSEGKSTDSKSADSKSTDSKKSDS